MSRFSFLAPLALLLLASVSAARDEGPGPAMPGMSDPAAAEMMAGMAKMNEAMAAAPVTGDADRDFVAMMLPHHQGAIDMARVELDHGKDPALRRLAEAIIAAQRAEIAQMQAWQAAGTASV